MEGIARDALWLVMLIAAPLLLAGLLTAFAISLFQAARKSSNPRCPLSPSSSSC